jgi:hypothetical protein
MEQRPKAIPRSPTSSVDEPTALVALIQVRIKKTTLASRPAMKCKKLSL